MLPAFEHLQMEVWLSEEPVTTEIPSFKLHMVGPDIRIMKSLYRKTGLEGDYLYRLCLSAPELRSSWSRHRHRDTMVASCV